MKKLLMVFVWSVAAAYALEPGKHYDFLQKNGQNVLGAELVAESATEYTVRLKYVPKPIKLNKENLAEAPTLSKVQPTAAVKLKLRGDFVVHGAAGFSYLTLGPLGKIFRTGYEARIGIDWQLFDKPVYRLRAVSAIATFASYLAAPRRIQLGSAFIGPKFLIWRFEALDAALFASPLIGISYADLKGYTFTSSYATLSAMGIISFEKRWKNLAFAAQLFANSLFDSSLNFASSGISLAVQYPLGQAAPY
jgi:hypothetical protein